MPLVRPVRICLITSTHVSANPRLVKEADALADAGYEVTVVAAHVNARLRKVDSALLETRRWTTTLVSRGSTPAYAVRTAVCGAARWLLARYRFQSLWLACLAHNRLIGRLTAAATRQRADLYIGHNLAALPAAARAAAANRANLGFDAEDFHTEEVRPKDRNSGDQAARSIIECELLPRCKHLTTAAPLIAAAYRENYNVQMQTVLNVFPLSEAPRRRLAGAKTVERSLYWFSQTIGAGRGLEAVLNGIAQMNKPPTLYLRGNPATGYVEALIARACRLGVAERMIILPPAAPSEMARLAQQYTLGLAIEPGSSRNNAMALSNKIFTYLLAGLPILLSRTRGQEELARDLGEAAILVDLSEPGGVARALEEFFADNRRQQRARAYASQLGQQRFNWDVEKRKFLACVAQALPHGTPSGT